VIAGHRAAIEPDGQIEHRGFDPNLSDRHAVLMTRRKHHYDKESI